MFSHSQEMTETNKLHRHWPLYSVAVFFILADLVAASYLIFEEYYQNKIYPGVSIGQIRLGGKTAAEAKNILEAKINDINQNGLKFNYGENGATIMPIISSFNGDIALQIITFNTDDIIERALSVGRGQGIYHNTAAQLRAALSGWKIFSFFSSDDELIKKMLVDNFGQFAAPAENAKLFATTTVRSEKKEIVLGVTDEKLGYQFDYDQALLKMKTNLEKLDNSPIELFSAKGYPDINKKELEPFAVDAQKFLDNAALTLVYADKKWPVAKEQFADWLMVGRATGSELVLGLDENKINDYLKQKAAPQIEVPPTDARFEIKDGKVVQFVNSRNGKKIDLDRTCQNLKTDFLAGGKNTVTIAVATVTSAITADQTNNLGITEIIGTGHSNFAGSPKNRVHNIGVGAAFLNGILIAPGTEFSTDSSLGEVTAATGYLPEMTIMGDKTVAQYGGGLCQIGTTVFRAALASGFPITARQAHSYRVVYYEPAGTDATIYQPWPDLRFINDSPNYVLIQTHSSGTDLYFDFWGTKDGRVVEQTAPTIYNIVKPLPTKYTETLSLPPGQKKCTERAHNGADAFFDYKVTYPDGTIAEKRFKSHYVPWREVCLIGVEKLSTSTPAAIPVK
ncbi:MAG: VanW family protein [Patescibacteria group bacterium]|nr:VanW family protein [Patescibacteria group bacterium]